MSVGTHVWFISDKTFYLGDALATVMFPAASLPRREETIVSKRMLHTEQAIDRSNRHTGY